jgi:hypothetical protein
LIKNAKARPYGWRNKIFSKDSEEYEDKKWIIFREKLKSIFNKIMNSKYFVEKYENDFYNYYILKN